MPTPIPGPLRTRRRAFLRLAALAPLAAACASTIRPSPRAAEPAAGPTPPSGVDPLEALRAFPIPADAEPAFVFRAAPRPPRGG